MIFVDSNMWIFSEVAEYPENKPALKKIESLMKEGIFTNAIVVSEVFHKLSKLLGAEESLRRSRNIVSGKSIVYLPIEKETIEKALGLTKYVRINDAILAQHAIDAKASLLTDNIKDFKKIKGLRLIKFR